MFSKIVNNLPGMKFGSFEEQRGVRIISLNPIQGVGGQTQRGSIWAKTDGHKHKSWRRKASAGLNNLLSWTARAVQV